MSNHREVSSVESLTAAAGKQRDHLILADHVSGLTPALNKVAWILALVLSVVLPAHAQQTTDEVQKQIQQLKQQYEQTTRELQERIAALEQQLKKESESQAESTKERRSRVCGSTRGGRRSKGCSRTIKRETGKSGTGAFRGDVRIPKGC